MAGDSDFGTVNKYIHFGVLTFGTGSELEVFPKRRAKAAHWREGNLHVFTWLQQFIADQHDLLLNVKIDHLDSKHTNIHVLMGD